MSADFGQDHAALSWRHHRPGDPVGHRPDEAGGHDRDRDRRDRSAAEYGHPPALGGPMKRRFPYATRLRQLPPYLFAEIDRLKQEAIKRGTGSIDLGVGDPDLPTPPPIVKRMAEAAADA